jgi:uncharacterized membrane protein
MSQEKNIQMDEALRKYRTLRMKVLSYNENCYPNAHFSAHHFETNLDYGNINNVECQVDEVE